MRRSTVAAALVLAALGAYIYWFERAPKDEGEGEPVFSVQKDAIDRIEIREKGKDPVVVEKKGSSWELEGPVKAKADATEIDLLLQNLSTMRFDRAVGKASEAPLADFGLDAPSLEVRFRASGGKEEGTLDFGKDAPTTSHQYARRDGKDEILVLRSHLSLNFDKSGWDLRDKAVFPGVPDKSETEPATIAMSRPSGALALENDRGLWRLTEPVRARADRYRVSSLVSRIRTARMKRIVAETPEEPSAGAEREATPSREATSRGGGVPTALKEAPSAGAEREATPSREATSRGGGVPSHSDDAYGLDAPTRRLRIEPPGGEAASEALELSIGAKTDDGYYARTPARAQIFVVGSDLVEELDRAASDFESTKLFEFSTFDVKRFRIETGGEVREIASSAAASKNDGGAGSVDEKTWRETSPAPGRELDRTAVEDFLYKLNGASATKVVEKPDLRKLGLDGSAPVVAISVWSRDPEVEEALRVSKPADGKVYAIRPGDEVALELTAEAWDGIEELMKLEPRKKEPEKTEKTKETPRS